MRVKLKKSEMQAMEMLLANILENTEVTNFRDKLFIAIFQKFYEKIAKALVVLQKEYSFKMDDITAIAFVLEIESWPLEPSNFTDNLALKLFNKINQHYT